jgi:hypothetical protein
MSKKHTVQSVRKANDRYMLTRFNTAYNGPKRVGRKPLRQPSQQQPTAVPNQDQVIIT